jgi:DNA ligase-1
MTKYISNKTNTVDTFPTLYGLSSKGVVKVWEISVQKHSNAPVIMIRHGQLGGKIQESPETIREGKNVGRANETTPYEQALLEAESKWKKQHDKNYTEKVPELVEGTTEPVASSVGPGKLLPMLAQKYNERAKYLVWPAYIQPKLNGVRCLVQRKGNKIFFWSRKAKQYKNFNLYMEKEFLSFMKDGDILDGEMYNHRDLTFQELMSLIKDEKTPDIEALKKYVKFWCYDHPTVEKLGFADRYVQWRIALPMGLNYLRLVETIKIMEPKYVDAIHNEYTVAGYEGSIIRSGGDEPYKFQYRDNQIQKNKDFLDAEFKIVGCKEGAGKDEGKAIFRCITKSSKEFDVRCKGSDEARIEQWKNRKSYIGKELTVKYQTLSDDGIPIFPVGIAVRDYE